MNQEDIQYLKNAINWLSEKAICEDIAEFETQWSYVNNSLELIDNLKPSNSPECVKSSVVDSKPSAKAALDKAVSAIWLNDRSDYLRALYGIVSSLTGIDDLTDKDIEDLFKELNHE